MRRSNKRPWHEPHVPLDEARARGGVRMARGPGGVQYQVRPIPRGEKNYVCPWCNQAIPVGTAHVVAWATEHLFGADAAIAERRHWHTGCWAAAERTG